MAVVDGKAQPVEDLLPPDFIVKIDGVRRRVVSAEHVKIDVEAARREAADPFESLYTTNLKPPNGRQIVIAVDQLGIRFGGSRPLLASAAKFLDRLSPADRVAFPEPGVQVAFTDDHLRLKRGMERVVGRQTPFSGKFNIGSWVLPRNFERQTDERRGVKRQLLCEMQKERVGERKVVPTK